MYCVLLLVLAAMVGASHIASSSSDHQDEVSVGTYRTCRVGDLLCSDDCDLLLLCLANHDTITVTNCTENEHVCDSRTFQCLDPDKASCEPVPDELDFSCHSTGLFPNPHDCHTYYTCSATGVHGIKQTCPNNDPYEYGYDPLFNTCSYTTKDRVCIENPIPVCKSATQSGAQTENPNIYYICVKDPNKEDALVPWLFRCNKANDVFDDVTKECVARIPTTAMTTMSTTEGTGGGGVGMRQQGRFLSLLFAFVSLFFGVVLSDVA